MTGEKGTYQAYMLRLWQTERDGEWVWWASLESPHNGERHLFTDVENLFDFLQEQVSSAYDQTQFRSKSDEDLSNEV